MAIIDSRVVYDEENDCYVVCVQFAGEPTKEDLSAAYKKSPYPWGTKEEPQALPSSYVKEDGWYDVGNADK